MEMWLKILQKEGFATARFKVVTAPAKPTVVFKESRQVREKPRQIFL